MNNLKKLRTENKFTLQELGDMCGMSKTHIHRLEKDSANPTLKTAYSLAKILGVTVYDIWPDTIEVIEETITVRRIKAS